MKKRNFPTQRDIKEVARLTQRDTIYYHVLCSMNTMKLILCDAVSSGTSVYDESGEYYTVARFQGHITYKELVKRIKYGLEFIEEMRFFQEMDDYD